MRALTLWQPWAWAICHAGKRIENRPWKPWPSVVGRDVAIHAGAKGDPDAYLVMPGRAKDLPLPADLPRSAVVAVARVTGWAGDDLDLSPEQRRWFSGPYGWTLEDVRVLPQPVPCKGSLGLWSLPPAVERDVLALLAAGRSLEVTP